MKILIADDDRMARIVLNASLAKLGHEVIEAEDGNAAWDLYEREEARLLVLDWVMPGLTGLELCRMIRAERRPTYTYIIMLTSMDGKQSYLQAMAAGADDFLTKPPDPDELKARLRVAERILGLQAEVRTLEALLSICSYCRKIRDEQDDWTDIQDYVSAKTDTAFSHGICPSCYEEHVVPQLEKLEE